MVPMTGFEPARLLGNSFQDYRGYRVTPHWHKWWVCRDFHPFTQLRATCDITSLLQPIKPAFHKLTRLIAVFYSYLTLIYVNSTQLQLVMDSFSFQTPQQRHVSFHYDCCPNYFTPIQCYHVLLDFKHIHVHICIFVRRVSHHIQL